MTMWKQRTARRQSSTLTRLLVVLAPAAFPLLSVLAGNTGAINGVAFSPDGNTLASASLDKTVKLWDVTSRKETKTIPAHSDWVLSIAYSPNGKLLATSSRDRTAKLWDATTGKP